MSKFLFLTLVVLIAPVGVLGEWGLEPDRGIGVSSSRTDYKCNIKDNAPGLLEVFVMYTGLPAKGISFAAPMPACTDRWVYLMDVNVFGNTTGNSQTGVSVDFGSCLSGPVHVLTIRYFATGTTPLCCMYPALPVSGSEVDAVACNGSPVAVTRLCNYINEQWPTCDCTRTFLGYPTEFFLCPAVVVPVESTTWGRVKALYAG